MMFRKSASQLNLVAVLAFVLAAGIVQAQTISGTLLGTVTDPSGNVIPKANVTVINESTGDQRSATTDTVGSFAFPSLLPGGYTVKVEAQGFRTLEKKNNVLTANERVSVGTLQMSIGSVSE